MIISVMSVMELSIAAVGILGALGACIHGSKCTRIKIGLCSGCECERDCSEGTDPAEGRVATIPEEEIAAEPRTLTPNQTNPNPA